MSRDDSLLDRIRCGMSIDDPIFAPISQDDEKTAPANDTPDQAVDPYPHLQQQGSPWWKSAGSAGAGSTGANSGPSPGIVGTGGLGPQNASNQQTAANQQVADIIILVKDPSGDVGIVGPFLNEDEAFDYVKQNGICADGFWIRVTHLLSPY